MPTDDDIQTTILRTVAERLVVERARADKAEGRAEHWRYRAVKAVSTLRAALVDNTPDAPRHRLRAIHEAVAMLDGRAPIPDRCDQPQE
jgi:hypothetical protein